MFCDWAFAERPICLIASFLALALAINYAWHDLARIKRRILIMENRLGKKRRSRGEAIDFFADTPNGQDVLDTIDALEFRALGARDNESLPESPSLPDQETNLVSSDADFYREVLQSVLGKFRCKAAAVVIRNRDGEISTNSVGVSGARFERVLTHILSSYLEKVQIRFLACKMITLIMVLLWAAAVWNSLLCCLSLHSFQGIR